MTKGCGTRSGLLWEVERLLNESGDLPQVLILENVPQVHSKKNMKDFQSWLDFLTSKGYKTYWKDLNAADYGIAQSRKRCFAVSILGDSDFTFPAPIPLDTVLKDYLEERVDDKFYLTNDKAKELIDTLIVNGKISLIGGVTGIELTINNPQSITVSHCILAGDRGISTYNSTGTGICEVKKYDSD
jgi:DNA (cytosine-5)-methyltransferase 1